MESRPGPVLHVRLRRPARATSAPRRLAAVSSHRAPRPAWGALYATTGALVAVGFVAVGVTKGSGTRRLIEVVLAAALLAGMALWRRANRMALARSGETLAAGRLRVTRVVRSQRPQAPLADRSTAGDGAGQGRVVRLQPEVRGVLPCTTTPGHDPEGEHG